MPASTIVLLTGGADSTTLLHVVNARAPVVPVFVDCGQRAAHREHQAAERAGVPESPGFYLHDAHGSDEGS